MVGGSLESAVGFDSIDSDDDDSDDTQTKNVQENCGTF